MAEAHLHRVVVALPHQVGGQDALTEIHCLPSGPRLPMIGAPTAARASMCKQTSLLAAPHVFGHCSTAAAPSTAFYFMEQPPICGGFQDAPVNDRMQKAHVHLVRS